MNFIAGQFFKFPKMIKFREQVSTKVLRKRKSQPKVLKTNIDQQTVKEIEKKVESPNSLEPNVNNKEKKVFKRKTNLEKLQESDDILTEFKTKEEKADFLSSFPEKLFSKKRKSPYFYLINSEGSKILAKHLLRNLPSPNTPIVEVNPGPRFLTRELLKNDNLQKLLLYENFDEFMPELEELHYMYPDKIQVKRGDFVNIWKLAFRDKLDNGSRLNDLLSELPKKPYNDEVIARIFVGTGSTNFFKHLINSLVFQNGLLSFGRCEFYVVMPQFIYTCLTCSNEASYLIYRATTVLFQIMFEHQFIDKLPQNYFLPTLQQNYSDPKKKLRKLKSVDHDSLYFVKIVPRKNVYELCPPEHMPALWFFVSQSLISRKRKIISNLEKWIPGCGPRIIVNKNKAQPVKALYSSNETHLPKNSTLCTTMTNHDYFDSINIFTEFGDLKPSQILTLFTQFRNWHEYKTSPFLASLENSLLKMEQAEESENINELDIPEEDIIHLVDEKEK